MRKLIFFVLLLIGFGGCAMPAGASDVKDKVILTDVKVETGKVTEVSFPEKVAKVVKGGEPDSILVEVLDESVYILPKTDVPPDIFVTTISGDSYPLKLHIAQEHDIKIQIGNRQPNSSRGTYSDVMDLMKDLLLNRDPVMATFLPEGGKVFLANQEIKLTVDKAYELGDWKAYVLSARNLINNAVIIPIEQMTLPNLLAVSSDQDMLSASGQSGDSTKVYMITGK